MKAQIPRLKDFILDIVVLILACYLGFMLSKEPNMDLTPKKSFASLNATQVSPNSTSNATNDTMASLIKRPKVEDKDIMERNLFTVDGKYGGKLDRPPENAYTLLAIMMAGKEKKALMRDFLGQQFFAKEKDILIDGFRVVKITDNSVILKRGKQTKELFILTPKKGPNK
jgi:hypothetical protein